MGDHPATPSPTGNDAGTRRGHLTTALSAVDTALDALDGGDHQRATNWTANTRAYLAKAQDAPRTGHDHTALDTAASQLAMATTAMASALGQHAVAARSRRDIQGDVTRQADLFADDARLHLRAARSALTGHTPGGTL